MADSLIFDEGAREILDSGFPGTIYLLLSTKSVDGTSPFVASDTLSSISEATGTGYARKSVAEPAASGRSKVLPQQSWLTGSATNWPTDVRSVVAATSSDNSGKALFARNLQAGGAARNLSGANTTETVQVTFSL